MAKNNISFYNPKELGRFDLGITQINKILPFTSVEGVFNNNAKIDFYSNRKLIKTISFADMSLIGDNTQSNSKTLSITLNGDEFKHLRGGVLRCQCISFFVEGDIEMIFDLEIK